MSEGLLQTLGTELVWQLLLTGFGLLVAVVLGVLALQGRRVPGAALPLGVGLVAAATTLLAEAALLDWARRDAASHLLGITTHAATHLLGLLAVGLVALTQGAVLAVAGARRGPRHALPAVLGALGVVATAGLVVAGGVSTANVPFAVVRALLYGASGALAVVALLSGGARGEGGAEAGAGAAFTFPLVVAIGEGSERGLAHLMMTRMLSHDNLGPGNWADAATAFRAHLEAEVPWSHGALACACAVALVGLLSVRRARRPPAELGGALGWIGLAWLLWLSADPPLSKVVALAPLAGG